MCVQTAEQRALRLEPCKAALCPIEYEIVFFFNGSPVPKRYPFLIEMLHKAILSHKATLGFPLVEFQLADM